MKAMKGFKTAIFNVLTAIITVGALFAIDIPAENAEAVAGSVIVLVNFVNLVLRAVTDSPLFKAR